METKSGINNNRYSDAVAQPKVTNVSRKNATGLNNWHSFLSNSNCNINNNTNNISNNNNVNESQVSLESDPKCRCIAIDCEMVGIGPDAKKNMLARVSLVNAMGDCLYDTFVRPTAPVTDYRTHVSGVRAEDLVNAKKFLHVRNEVAQLIKGKILVGHAVFNDLCVLNLKHPRRNIRDTSLFKKFNELTAGTPSLKRLTSHFLNVSIQDGEHSSVQDAQAAMQLYMLHRKEWETDMRQQKYNYYIPRQKKKTKPTHRPRRLHKNYKKK